jgi:hypothetical protein
LRVLLLAAACCAPAVGSARSVTYTYAGQDYTLLSGKCLTASMAVTIKFTVKTALGPNFSGTITPISWAAGDGKTKFSSKSATASSSIAVGTDGNGNINSWTFFAEGTNAKGATTEILSADEPFIGASDTVLAPCGKSTDQAESMVAGSWSF